MRRANAERIQNGLALHTGSAVVCQHAGRGVVDVAVGPCLVGHPEAHDGAALVVVVFLEDLAVEQALLGKGHTMCRVVCPAHLELLVGVKALGILLDIIHHAVAHGIGEGGLFAPEDLRGQPVALKGLAQQVLALAVAVQLLFGVNGHDVAHKIQIAKGHAGLDAVGGNAAVGPQHIVHVQLPDALLALLLEGIGGGGVVGVLVAEQLIGDLAGQQHADVGVLVDVLTDQLHAHRRADGGNIPGAEHGDDLFQRVQHDVAVDDDLGVVGAYVIGDLPGVFKVDGVGAHAYRKGLDGLVGEPCGDGAYQRRIKSAGEQETDGCVGVKPFLNARYHLLFYLGTGGLDIVVTDGLGAADIVVADEFAVLIVVPRFEFTFSTPIFASIEVRAANIADIHANIIHLPAFVPLFPVCMLIISVPIPISTIAIILYIVSCSPRKINDISIARTVEDLSIGATLFTSPIFNALK